MKKVLFIINTLRFGGAEKSLISLLKALDYSKFKVDLLLFEDDGPLKAEVPSEVNIIYGGDINRAMILEYRLYAKSLLKSGHVLAYTARLRESLNAKLRCKTFNWYVIKNHIKPLNGHYDTAVSYLEGHPAYYLIDKVDADRKIAWIHTDVSKKVLGSDEVHYYSKADMIVTISEQCRIAINQKIPSMKDRTIVIENLSDPEEIRKLAELPASGNRWNQASRHIVTVGRLTEAKGIDQAIDAYKILSKKDKNLQWHVYGDGELRDTYKKLIDDKHIDNGFILEGAVTNPYRFMRMADIIVQPSKWEGKSVVLDEAKILGKAIVVTNYVSVKDQIVDGENGLIADMNPESIAEKIEIMLNDSDLKKKIETNNLRADTAYHEIAASINKLLDGSLEDY